MFHPHRRASVPVAIPRTSLSSQMETLCPLIADSPFPPPPAPGNHPSVLGLYPFDNCRYLVQGELCLSFLSASAVLRASLSIGPSEFIRAVACVRGSLPLRAHECTGRFLWRSAPPPLTLPSNGALVSVGPYLFPVSLGCWHTTPYPLRLYPHFQP